jgi:hypothetical protein
MRPQFDEAFPRLDIASLAARIGNLNSVEMRLREPSVVSFRLSHGAPFAGHR